MKGRKGEREGGKEGERERTFNTQAKTVRLVKLREGSTHMKIPVYLMNN